MKSVTVLQSSPVVTVQTPSVPVVVEQRSVNITIFSEELQMSIRFKKFDFTATQDQTVFTLETIPISMIALYINGVAQNEEDGDFSIVGMAVTLNAGVDAGDHVFGVYQEIGT